MPANNISKILAMERSPSTVAPKRIRKELRVFSKEGEMKTTYFLIMSNFLLNFNVCGFELCFIFLENILLFLINGLFPSSRFMSLVILSTQESMLF